MDWYVLVAFTIHNLLGLCKAFCIASKSEKFAGHHKVQFKIELVDYRKVWQGKERSSREDKEGGKNPRR